MARLPNQPTMDQGLMDLMGLAQVSQSMGLNEPPAIGELLKLLGMASEMQQQEQAVDLKRQELELTRQKQNRMSPEMLDVMLRATYDRPEIQRSLLNQVQPGLIPEGEAASPKVPIGKEGEQGPSKLPASRLDVKSQKAFMGYEPPPGAEEGVEAVLDENGNVINFVRTGTQTPVEEFVPSAESLGGWAASKYATAQQLKALGRFLGLAPGQKDLKPY